MNLRPRDEVLQRDVALKFIGESLAQEGRQWLLREARAASRLNHPSICTVHDVGEAEDQFYIVMELIEGGTLLASALVHAHARKVIHRDLKSQNVLITPEGLVKVLDFGLARRLAFETAHEGTGTIETLPKRE